MTPTELREAGEALYGPRFTTDLARNLNVAVRTVQRWLSGDRAIPARRSQEIVALVAERHKTLNELIVRYRS